MQNHPARTEKINEKLRIIGLGRCTIGHLRKNIESTNVTFHHHYLLNPATCLYSSCSEDELLSLLVTDCAPSLPDQIQCLQNMHTYDVCVIELFPPAPLYKHRSLNIHACFESFTQQLADLGFKPYSHQDEKAIQLCMVEYHTQIIEKLVKKITKLNKDIKIIFTNGELTHNDRWGQTGSQFIYKLLMATKNSSALRGKHIQLLDINDILKILDIKGEYFYEMAFPHIYIRHGTNLQPTRVVRDCKHATAAIRTHLAHHFAIKLHNLGFTLPEIPLPAQACSCQGKTFTARADRYIKEHTCKPQLPGLFDDPKTLSLFTSYTLATENQLAHDILRSHIAQFASRMPSCGADLKNFFYHIRTMTAYIHETKAPLLSELNMIGLHLLELTANEIMQYSNFVLLWVKNLYLAGSSLAANDKSESSRQFHAFIGEIANNTFLKDHEVIRKILLRHTNSEYLYPKVPCESMPHPFITDVTGPMNN